MKSLFSILFLLLTLGVSAQNFTHSGTIRAEGNTPIPNIVTKLSKRTPQVALSSTLNVRVYSTHAGNGNTSQYGQYPTVTSDFDRLFNTGFSNTQLRWTGTLPTTTCLNFTTFTTLRNAGATIPNNGDYYSVEVFGTFIPQVTGQYSFGINSDDGSDLFIGGTFVVSYYGGHGMSGPIYGTINLVAGTQYTFRARMQEYAGGDGLSVVWRRPGQSTHTLQTSELGILTTTPGSWQVQSTQTTNLLGQYSYSSPTTASDEWSIEITIPTVSSNLASSDYLGIDSVVLGRIPTKSIHFHKYELNGDTRISVGDIYTISRRINGLSYQKRTLLFTETQWNNLLSGTADTRVSIPGVLTTHSFTPISGGVSNFYLLSPGFTNQSSLVY